MGDVQRIARERQVRGRPCPMVHQGVRCNGGSEVMNVRQTDDRTIRWRRCLVCGHRWRTSERDDG